MPGIKSTFNTAFPSVSSLKKKAKSRIPKFAFEYLDGGCNEDINLARNINELSQVQLMPYYLRKFNTPVLKTTLFGDVYDAPFGISPIGLQGLIWPGAPEILARAAFNANIPFILSTVSTSSIEKIAAITEGKTWFQLYHPAKEEITEDILRRLEAAQIKVLVLLVDVPSFGFRPRDIKNGLAMPPRLSVSNIIQILGKPAWGIETLKNGLPNFATLKPYMGSGYNIKKLGQFMNETFAGKVDEDKVKWIRDRWKGTLVLKGIVNEEDTEKSVRMGVDGVIVSNHGGRQIDAGESTIASLKRLVPNYKDKIKIMIDSGLRSGPDIARCIACGADFTFMGRPFMYGVAVLGKEGGTHTINLLQAQLKQVMEQLGCPSVESLPDFLIR